MKPFEERFTAWIDGQLPEEERAAFEKELATHPEAAAEREAALRMRSFLRAHPTAPELSNAEFFNLQLQQRIAAEMPAAPRTRESWSFWKVPRLAWGGLFCLLMAGVLFKTLIPPTENPELGAPYFAQVVEAWPADPGISATTIYNPRDNVTVLWLDGLEPIPANYQLQ